MQDAQAWPGPAFGYRTSRMFEAAELGRKVSKRDFSAQELPLRERLLELQRRLTSADFPVLILLGGGDASGRSETANVLKEWLDVRYIETHSFGRFAHEEDHRPPSWKFWRTLPPKGRIAIYVGSWYTEAVEARAAGRSGAGKLQGALEHIRTFETMLADDGALILKFWLHIPYETQKRRLEKLAKNKLTAWRVTKESWAALRRYDQRLEAAAEAIRRTDSAETPWFLVESVCERYRSLTLAETVARSIEERLKAPRASRPPSLGPLDTALPARLDGERTVLEKVEQGEPKDDPSYEKKLEKLQEKLGRLTWEAFDQRVSTVLVFEGWDAAGKGGAIRRVSSAVDARLLRVISIAAPTDEEKAHHYLWRFWRHVPVDGRVTVYDRSWYGRVLVERVEGFAQPEEWKRAYREINEFEDELVSHGTVLLKFFLHITPEEQLRRFKERETVAYKQHKITEEDYRNRAKWKDYEAAIDELVARTSTRVAPWALIGANDKRSARLEVLSRVVRGLEAGLK